MKAKSQLHFVEVSNWKSWKTNSNIKRIRLLKINFTDGPLINYVYFVDKAIWNVDNNPRVHGWFITSTRKRTVCHVDTGISERLPRRRSGRGGRRARGEAELHVDERQWSAGGWRWRTPKAASGDLTQRDGRGGKSAETRLDRLHKLLVEENKGAGEEEIVIFLLPCGDG